MWKLAFTLLISLNVTIGAMLLWQWNAYSEYHNPSELGKDEKAVQHITIESKGGVLSVTQVIEGLAGKGEYRINAPNTISDWECATGDGVACSSKDDNSLQAQNESLTFRYQIQLNDDDSAFLLRDWLIQLPDVEVTHTTVDVISAARREGTWVVGFPLKGYSKLEYIDYYVFEGKGGDGSLYWQPTPLVPRVGEKGIQLYTTNDSQTNFSKASFDKIPNFNEMAVVLTDSFAETYGSGVMIAKPSLDSQELERRMIDHYFIEKAPELPSEERWILGVLTSIVEERESHNPKVNLLIEELKRHFTEDEIAQFLALSLKENSLTPQKLDEILSSIAEKNTRFFSLNKNAKTNALPLYFYDSRSLYIGDALKEDIDVILVGNEQFFPFIETMNSLGYEAQLLDDHETVNVNLRNDSYRFYVSQNIYFYNQEHYGLLENPLRMINGRPYMSNRMLKSLFQISFNENEDEIKLSLAITE
ncbi:hypothetical protein PZE06_00780 [Robertmurraya sp. DFI.2.37]|uniref:stalk domain-containing protein n=1 Tax=Robertmurraya sp. DFI.2.37 TaxID=3031819 RepID=UPI00178362F6|nr:stalk domain-containing protein [Robertmurraya sp. DFI.2.37]MDF1506706.1 hypothetical protein [Robertmurraya sp. DFI.2.37]